MRRRLIECDRCQRPWRLGDYEPADRICGQCRNPGAAHRNPRTGCPACGLIATEPNHLAEHCYPIAPPNVTYLAAKDQLRAANEARRTEEEKTYAAA